MDNHSNRKDCGCSKDNDPCLHQLRDSEFPDTDLKITPQQLPKYLEFAQKHRFAPQIRVAFSSLAQKAKFEQFIKKPAIDFDASFINPENHDDDEPFNFVKETVSKSQPHEVSLKDPYPYLFKVVNFFKHCQEYAKDNFVDIQLVKNTVHLISDSKSCIEKVETYIKSIISSCSYLEVRKSHWEAISLNNSKKIIQALNKEKIAFTKIEESQDSTKLLFFWKNDNDNLPAILQYIQKTTFASVKILKNKKIQKQNLNPVQLKIMNKFAQVKTKLFQKNFELDETDSIKCEIKIDEKFQIFNRLIYQFPNIIKNPLTKNPYRDNLESQVNRIVYFGLLVSGTDKLENINQQVQLIEFSQFKIDSLNLIVFAIDSKNLNKQKFDFMNQLSPQGLIFDNFDLKLKKDHFKEFAQHELSSIKQLKEKDDLVQLVGLMNSKKNQPAFWKTVLKYIIDMSEKVSQNSDEVPFSNFQAALNQQKKPENNKPHQEQQKEQKRKYENPLVSDNAHPNKVINSPQEDVNSSQILLDFCKDLNLAQAPILGSYKARKKSEENIQPLIEIKKPAISPEDIIKQAKFDSIFDSMDEMEEENEILTPYLKECNRTDQETIHLQLKCISKSYKISKIYKNFNQGLFEYYEEMKKRHEVQDYNVILLKQEKQVFCYDSNYKDIVEQGVLKEQKLFFKLDKQLDALKQNQYIFICHVLFKPDVLIEQKSDYYLLKEHKVAFPTYVVQIDKKK